MQPNMGTVDRVIRIIIGIAILALGVIFRSWWGLLGLLPLLIASINFCPLYAAIGVKTNKAKPSSV